MKQIQFQSGSNERRILIAMVVDPKTVSAIAAKWKKNGRFCFRSNYARIIGNWAVEHWKKYQLPIGRQIEDRFELWSKEADAGEVEAVERFLQSLDREFRSIEKSGPFNSNYYIEMANSYFDMTHLRQVRDELENAIEDEDLERGMTAIDSYSPIGIGRNGDTIVTFDQEQRREIEMVNDDVLVRYPGALGQFLGNDLARGNFFVFLASEKKGKSTWLLDLAFRSWVQGNKVAFFTIGDMNKKAIMRRLLTRMVRHPAHPCQIEVPVRFDFDELTRDEQWLYTRAKEFGVRTDKLVAERTKKYMRAYGRTRSQRMRIVEAPASTFTCQDLVATLQRWSDEGFVPDVLCLDYIDLMALPTGQDIRNGTHLNWMQIRGLNQELDFLFVTATQANAASYTARLLGAHSFSEDKRKNAHPTGVMGLNQTPHEKERGVYRVNWIMRREEEFNPLRCCHTAGSMKLGCPTMISALPPKDFRMSYAETSEAKSGDFV